MTEPAIPLHTIRTRAELLAAGHTDRSIARTCRAGHLVRVRHGAYVDGELWRSLDDRGHHRLRSRAVMINAAAESALSHVSAAVEHGASGWGFDLDEVHLTRLDGRSGRREAGVVQHRGRTRADALHELDGLVLTTPARCAAEAMSLGGVERSLVLAHELIHRGRTTPEEVLRAYAETERWPGTLGSNVLHRLVPVPCESVAESRFLHLCRVAGLPLPEAQFEIVDHGGVLVARLDFAWPGLGRWVEIDGRVKYDDPHIAGRSPSMILWREKRREDTVRHVTGWRCLRVTWADLQSPERLVAILTEFLRLDDRAA